MNVVEKLGTSYIKTPRGHIKVYILIALLKAF